MNRKQLRSSQEWIDPQKLSAALRGDRDDKSPSADLVTKNGSVVCLVVTDGHHRTSVAIHQKLPISFRIINLYEGDVPYNTWGFNKIYNKVRVQISQI